MYLELTGSYVLKFRYITDEALDPCTTHTKNAKCGL